MNQNLYQLTNEEDLKERNPLFAAIIFNGFMAINENKYDTLSTD
ncbi:hypothetical protein [Bacillus sp. Cs-700]|nr:hypothetical protein [Bacillus sp. Cs-700]